MRLSFVSLSLAGAAAVFAGPVHNIERAEPLAPALPASAFNTSPKTLLTLDEAKNKVLVPPGSTTVSKDDSFSIKATCSNPRTRVEWEKATAAQRKAFVDAIKCVFGKPSKFSNTASKNRYEDYVLVHQRKTPNVHNNQIFLPWHRYFLQAFDEELRSCGLGNNPFLWFDETKRSGTFSQSSIFSSEYFGSINLQGKCVTNGVFANTNLNIGPGTGNTRHCLSRNGDAAKTKNVTKQLKEACYNRDGFSNFAICAEGGNHAWGHNGVGGAMADVYASVGDPVFWMHHAMVDRDFRVWQNVKASRKTTVDGRGPNGSALTWNTVIDIEGIKANVRVGDVMDTLDTRLCYKYDY